MAKMSLQKMRSSRQRDLLILEYGSSEAREECVVRPYVFACHCAIFFRRPNRARPRLFPSQVKTLVEVPAIPRVGVFTE
jgi:hypothetical protein